MINGKLFTFFCFYFFFCSRSFSEEAIVNKNKNEIDIDLIGNIKGRIDQENSNDNQISIDLTKDVPIQVVKSKQNFDSDINSESKKSVTPSKENMIYNNIATYNKDVFYKKNGAENYKNSNLEKIEKNMNDDRYSDVFYKNIHIDSGKSAKKKEKKTTKFEIKVVDVNDTLDGSITKNLQEAFNCYKQKDYELAVFFYKKALLNNPQSVEARFGIGVSYQMLRQYDQAIDEYLKLFEKKYSRKKIVNNLLLCLQHKSYEKSLEILLSIDSKILGYADVLSQIGVIYMKIGDNQKAISAFSRAHEISPTNAIVAYNLGILYDREKNIDFAKHFFEIAIRNGISDVLEYHDNERLNERLKEIDEQISNEIKQNKKK